MPIDLSLPGVLLKAAWVPGQGCVITQTNTTVLSATFIYSMCFDLVVLILTTVKLLMPGGRRSQLMNMLFKDGLIYFLIAYVPQFVLLSNTDLRCLMAALWRISSRRSSC